MSSSSSTTRMSTCRRIEGSPRAAGAARGPHVVLYASSPSKGYNALWPWTFPRVGRPSGYDGPPVGAPRRQATLPLPPLVRRAFGDVLPRPSGRPPGEASCQVCGQDGALLGPPPRRRGGRRIPMGRGRHRRAPEGAPGAEGGGRGAGVLAHRAPGGRECHPEASLPGRGLAHPGRHPRLRLTAPTAGRSGRAGAGRLGHRRPSGGRPAAPGGPGPPRPGQGGPHP